MAIQDDKTLLCKGDLKAYHESISPYLGGNLMLGTNVSDYYSEDEKVIGVWTDGKPAYQKTIVTNTGSSGIATYSIASWNIDKIINYNGIIEQIVNEKYYYPNIFYNADSTYHCNIYLDRDNNKVLNIGVGSGYYNYNVYITIQYTKTTDTANSAVTTPGCYDINRPDTWPANREIFFGNGLYGKRYTGNTPTFAKNSSGIIFTDTTITVLSSIINYGGSINLLNNNEVSCIRPICSTYSTTGELVSHLNLTSNPNRNIILMGKFISDYTTTSCTYNVWVTYTK